MRKKCGFLLMLILMFFMTGCVKFNANMNIKKDKSMIFEIIYAVETGVFGDDSLMDSEAKANLINSGFEVEDYVDGTMKGVTISRKVKNIDFVSSSNAVQYSLSNLFEKEVASSAVFMVKKGLFKNVYTADFVFDSSDSDLNDGDDSFDECDGEDCIETDDSTYDDEFVLDEDSEMDVPDGEDGGNDMDFSGLMSSMDLSFEVTLPYAAISNNATEVNNDGKSLKWKLTTDDVSSMQFQFSLYNMTIIYIFGGIVLLLLIVVFLVVKKKIVQRKKGQPINEDVNDSSLQVDQVSGLESDNMFINNNVYNQTSTQNNDMMSNGINNMNGMGMMAQQSNEMPMNSNVDVLGNNMFNQANIQNNNMMSNGINNMNGVGMMAQQSNEMPMNSNVVTPHGNIVSGYTNNLQNDINNNYNV